MNGERKWYTLSIEVEVDVPLAYTLVDPLKLVQALVPVFPGQEIRVGSASLLPDPEQQEPWTPPDGGTFAIYMGDGAQRVTSRPLTQADDSQAIHEAFADVAARWSEQFGGETA